MSCESCEVRDSVSGLTSSPRTFLYGCRIKGKKIGIYDKNMSTIIKQIYAISDHNKRTRATLTWSVRTQLFGYNLGSRKTLKTLQEAFSFTRITGLNNYHPQLFLYDKRRKENWCSFPSYTPCFINRVLQR